MKKITDILNQPELFLEKYDSNGNPLYTGDTVKYIIHITHGPHEEGTGKIKYDAESACFLIDNAYMFDELSRIEKVNYEN